MYTTDIGVECTYNGAGTSGYIGNHYAFKALDSSIDTISTIILISDFRNSVAGNNSNKNKASLSFRLTNSVPTTTISTAYTAFNGGVEAAVAATSWNEGKSIMY